MPPLRFPEFTDEWEKCTLGDITECFNLRNKHKHQYPMYSVTNDRGFVPQTEQFEGRDMIGDDIKAYKLIGYGDFAYNPARINVGSIAMYKGDETCMISSLYVCFKAKNQIEKEWLIQLLKTHRLNFHYNINGEGGVRVYLFYPNFARIRVSYPSLKEQKRIAAFLNLIDKRIALQTKIIEKYKSLIKGIGDVLLVDNSSRSIPLSEILIEFSEKTTKNNQYEVLSSTVSGIYSQKEIFNKEVASSNNIGYKIIHYDDVVLSPQNLWMGNINYNDKYKIGIVSPSYKTYRIAEDYDKKFIAAILKTHRALYNYMLVSEQGASVVRRNLNIEAFEQLIFKIPNCEKQQKIGNILRNLEYKLSRLERLKNCYLRQKQFFLQQMFI